MMINKLAQQLEPGDEICLYENKTVEVKFITTAQGDEHIGVHLTDGRIIIAKRNQQMQIKE